MLLASACALMLAVGIAARAATPTAPVAIVPGQALGPGTYGIPFRAVDGTKMSLVFTVPTGLHITFDGVGWGSDWTEVRWALPAFFSGGGKDAGFWFCLDVATAEECARGYPAVRIPEERVDDYGVDLRIPGALREADRAERAAKYGPLLDRVVASARIVTVR